MENDTLATPPVERPRLPRAGLSEPTATSQVIASPVASNPALERPGAEANGIFRNLVSDDADIAGLVAYSIYKQNKLDWLAAFEAAKGRAPDDTELASYIIGEGTPRRIATYRHLAEATLSGKGPEGSGRGLGRPALRDGSALSPTAIAAYAVILLVMLVGFWMALHYTVATH